MAIGEVGDQLQTKKDGEAGGGAASAEWSEVFEWEVGFPVAEVWEVVRDFGGIHKWAPTVLAICSIVEGVPQQPGCVRLVQTHPDPSAAAGGGGGGGQALEKLLHYDPLSHSLSYVVVSSSVPFLAGLTPSFRLLPTSSPSSTRILWSYRIPALGPSSQLDQPSLRHWIRSNLYELCISDLVHTLTTLHSTTAPQE